MLSRPKVEEYQEYYHRYVSKVPEGDIVTIIERQIDDTVRFLESIDEGKATHRYQPDKWSVKEVVGHLIDTERVFQYRCLAFARRDPARLPGMEQDDYAAAASYHDRPFGDIIAEYRATREAGLALFRSLNAEEAMRTGIANEVEFTARAVPYIIAGHTIHHIGVIRERYL